MNRFALQPAQVDSVLPADGRRPVRLSAKYSRLTEPVNPVGF